ncbi:CobW family GTP-binding protein [Paenibacillus mendelii]|uniref:CobW family GTP-binding protein n=1 Tax=Paenibacillus mendelii TaxID=206163 RepID=A0ABV6JD38_9BACL|nr:CobW family GTP-binding protein [Paenibacillus mendelii]MCQ6562629.1 GTP-binding protein [Paenibacillus mendelii]
MENSSIPVIVISGFLGSGKTTLLLRLLNGARTNGLRASVLMNEIGAIDVDGRLVSGETASQMLERVTEGCLCCTKKSELAHCLERLVLRQPDVILMELTGVANPEEIVEAMSEPAILGKVALHRIVTVLDAEHATDYNSIFSTDRELVHTLRRQIEAADIVLGNKADLISAKTAAKVEGMVRGRNPHCQLIPTERCAIDPMLILSGIVSRTVQTVPVSRVRASVPVQLNRKAPAAGVKHSSGTAVQTSEWNRDSPSSALADHPGGEPAAGSPSRSYTRIQTVAIYPDTAPHVSRRSFEAFFSGRGQACLRAKGYMPYGDNGAMLLFQYAGKRFEWQPADYTGTPYFVMIGIDLAEDQIIREWQKLMRR